MNIYRYQQRNISKPISIFNAATILILFFSVQHCFAELDFSPYIQVEEVYNSNIFYTPDEESDFITIGSVGFDFLVAKSELDINFNYQVDQLEYADNTTENVTYHSVNSEANWKLTRDFQLFATETFLKTAEPASAELTQREDRINNVAALRAQIDVRKTALEVGYTNIYESYDDIDTRDSRQDVVSGIFNYYHHWDLSAFVWYDHGWINYDEEERSDGDFDEVTTGVKGNLGPRTVGQARGGFRWQNYDDIDREDFSGFTVYVDITHDFPGRSSIIAYATRTIEESFFEDNTYYEVIIGSVTFIRELSDMLRFSIRGAYQLDQYPVDSVRDGTLTKREEDIYSGAANLRVDLGKGVEGLLTYEFVDNGSNFSEFDYTGHRVAAQARVTF